MSNSANKNADRVKAIASDMSKVLDVAAGQIQKCAGSEKISRDLQQSYTATVRVAADLIDLLKEYDKELTLARMALENYTSLFQELARKTENMMRSLSEIKSATASPDAASALLSAQNTSLIKYFSDQIKEIQSKLSGGPRATHIENARSKMFELYSTLEREKTGRRQAETPPPVISEAKYRNDLGQFTRRSGETRDDDDDFRRNSGNSRRGRGGRFGRYDDDDGNNNNARRGRGGRFGGRNDRFRGRFRGPRQNERDNDYFGRDE